MFKKLLLTFAIMVGASPAFAQYTPSTLAAQNAAIPWNSTSQQITGPMLNSMFANIINMLAQQFTCGSTPCTPVGVTSVGTALPGNIPAIQTSANGCSTCVGAFAEQTSSDIAITTSTVTDIVQIALPGGDWDCNGVLGTTNGSAATPATTIGWISTVSATNPFYPNHGAFFETQFTSPAGAATVFPTGTIRITSDGATSAYLSTQINYSGSGITSKGNLRCRRAR